MPEFSLKKLNEIKNSQFLTFKDIADMTKIPASTISKIFGGFNKNPSIESLLKIANALDCGIDDFIEYDKMPKSPYFIDRETAKLALEIYENSNLRDLFENCKNLVDEDITALNAVSLRLKSRK